MLPWEQKGCGRGSRGTKDHSLIDKSVMKDSRERETNLMLGLLIIEKPGTWYFTAG